MQLSHAVLLTFNFKMKKRKYKRGLFKKFREKGGNIIIRIKIGDENRSVYDKKSLLSFIIYDFQVKVCINLRNYMILSS